MRNWLRAPSKSIAWLWDSAQFSLGVTRKLALAPDWTLICHPYAYKVTYRDQVSDSDQAKWNLALNNARNIQTDLGAANVDVEIVAYGPGIGMLKMDSPVGGRIDEATTAGVKVIACENTMKGQKLTRADMLNGISYVPAGVVELMSRQQQGWAYIRP